MNIKNLQKQVKETFEYHFGYTPLNERLKDIQNEFFELMKWQDINNIKEETGDLLASLIQLCNESGWDVEELIQSNKDKISKREKQYRTLGRKVKVAILGGAFNPVTKAHIQLAQFVLNTTGEFDEVWLMPAYNHMFNKQMESPEDRLEMCRLAAQVDGRIKVFDYEIKNKLAGETYNLFKRLKQDDELNNKYNFSMIIGIDNANSFHKWVNFQELERMVRFVVVDRKGFERDESVDWYLSKPHIYLNNEDGVMEGSSTIVRELLNDNDISVEKYIDNKVLEFIKNNKLYKN
ncbi:MAG: nicotinate (nicotinamide) nucleotide adenylyltransferase [bacterium]